MLSWMICWEEESIARLSTNGRTLTVSNYIMSLTGEHIYRLKALRWYLQPDGRSFSTPPCAFTGPQKPKWPKRGNLWNKRQSWWSRSILSSVICRMEKHKEETIGTFQKVVEYFGRIYHSYFDKNATPKLHLLEVHASIELRKNNRLS